MTVRRTIGALLTGLLFIVIFPDLSWEPLAYIALTPLALAVVGTTRKEAFRLGYVAGLVANLGVFYWTYIVMHVYGGVAAPIAVAGVVMLAAYLAFYFGAFAIGLEALRRRFSTWYPLLGACLWTGLEYVRGHLFSGFPWELLGYSQFQSLAAIQVAEWTAVYGVSFLLAFTALAVAARAMRIRMPGAPGAAGPALLAGTLVAANLVYGGFRVEGIRDASTAKRPIRVGIVQPNIPQDLKWDREAREHTMEVLFRLTRAASGIDTDIVVWPESATPFFFEREAVFRPALQRLAREVRTPILFGSGAIVEHGSRREYYNSAFLLSADGTIAGRYDKIHLVPFGEYVPLRRFLPFLRKVATGLSPADMSPGTEATLFPAGERAFGTLICYESIFPDLVRRFPRSGADFLVNITNDAWFGRSSAPMQHLSHLVFRAVENRIGIARSANTGISASVTPAGELKQMTGLFTQASVDVSITPRLATTFYTKRGDVFAWTVLGVAAAAFLIRKKKTGSGSAKERPKRAQ